MPCVFIYHIIILDMFNLLCKIAKGSFGKKKKKKRKEKGVGGGGWGEGDTSVVNKMTSIEGT
jgi:hypothetical protein